MPATTIGKLFFNTGNGTASCTATVLSAPNKDTIWTAGHCVGNGHGSLYTDIVFQPDRNGNSVPFGSFKAKYISVSVGWAIDALPQYDYAAVALDPNVHGKAQNVVGSQGWIMGGNRYNWPGLYIFGYPGILYPSRQPVNSNQLRYCTGSTTEQNSMLHYQCDMGNGSSGGPLIYQLELSRGWGYIVGNVSVGNPKTYDTYSPQLSSVALATLQNAYKR